MPLVSVCIPTYNQVTYLRKCLQSVIEQDFTDYEIIISDDSSDDSVAELVDEFKLNHDLIYIRNVARKGSPDNWNAAISLSKGNYIKILHHDDWFSRRDSLSIFVSMLEENHDVDFAFSANLVVDVNGDSQFVHAATTGQIDGLRKNPNMLFFGNSIGAPSCTIFRRVVQEQFNTQLKWVVDIDFYISVLKKNGRFMYFPEPLVCCSLGVPGQLTSACFGNRNIELYEWIYLYKKMEDLSLLNCRRTIFVWNLLKGHNVKSVKEIVMSGLELPVPIIVRILVLLLRIQVVYSVLKVSFINAIRSQKK